MCEYGYLNHSSTDKRDEEAIRAMFAVLPCEQVTVEQMWSPGETRRPAFERLVQRLLPGDVLYVHTIDRLGVGVNETLRIWNAITKERKAHIVVLDTPALDTRTHPNISRKEVKAAAEKAFFYVKQALKYGVNPCSVFTLVEPGREAGEQDSVMGTE